MSIFGRLYYRVEEVADLLDISLRTAYRAIEKGDIPSTKIRGCIRISVAEFHSKFGAGTPNVVVSMSSTSTVS